MNVIERVMELGVSPFVIIIPARFRSTRFPGKPLVEIYGATGLAKSAIQRTWEAAVSASCMDRVWVATDDLRIASAVSAFGGRVVMTSSHCRNGTERCAEAAEKIPDCPDIIVNFQGDAPLTPPFVIGQLAAALEDSGSAMTTAALPCSQSTYDHLAADAAAGRVGGTTVILNQRGEALYFSKRLLPYVPPGTPSPNQHVHLHLGVYAYRREELARYAAAPPSPLELLEGLEQLRFLDQGQVVKVVPVDPVGRDCIELNNPSDVAPIEAILYRLGIE